MKPKQDHTAEEQALLESKTRSSWDAAGSHEYRARDVDRLTDLYMPDAISMPSYHPAMEGHDEIRAWYSRRTGDYEMNIQTEAHSVEIVGDVAVVIGIFRVTRRPERGVAGLDHAGRFLSVLRRVDGTWRLWRDMDCPSPDADVLYDRLPRGA